MYEEDITKIKAVAGRVKKLIEAGEAKGDTLRFGAQAVSSAKSRLTRIRLDLEHMELTLEQYVAAPVVEAKPVGPDEVKAKVEGG